MADNNRRDDDIASEAGGEDMFRVPSVVAGGQRPGVTRKAAAPSVGWGRGPVQVDKRKIRYDVTAAMTRKQLSFGATKVDRLDAEKAGDMLHRIHQNFGLENELEERIYAFDQGLWYEHAVNGGSTLQAERGCIRVDGMEFDLSVVVKVLGVDARRFFRAFADEITVCLRGVLSSYDQHDAEAAEKQAAVMQVAVARGLQKYPYLIHDSSDAGVLLSVEERMALLSSKQHVISNTTNAADAAPGRVGPSMGYRSAGAVNFDRD